MAVLSNLLQLLKRKKHEEETGSTNDKIAEKENKECQEWKEKYNQVYMLQSLGSLT
jgi:hypothetical protein